MSITSNGITLIFVGVLTQITGGNFDLFKNFTAESILVQGKISLMFSFGADTFSEKPEFEFAFDGFLCKWTWQEKEPISHLAHLPYLYWLANHNFHTHVWSRDTQCI